MPRMHQKRSWRQWAWAGSQQDVPQWFAPKMPGTAKVPSLGRMSEFPVTGRSHPARKSFDHSIHWVFRSSSRRPWRARHIPGFWAGRWVVGAETNRITSSANAVWARSEYFKACFNGRASNVVLAVHWNHRYWRSQCKPFWIVLSSCLHNSDNSWKWRKCQEKRPPHDFL